MMTDPIKEIISIIGENNTVIQSSEIESYIIEGKTPKVVAFPKTIEEISEIMKVAWRESLAVIPRGGGTKSGFGMTPRKVDLVLSTKHINQVIEHESSDLVATVQCGIPLEKFQEILGRKNQFLAIDPPHRKSGATVGGIIATNDSGPRRLKYGTMRELLLGIKVIRPDGSIVKGGAKVVKNVAGYDLPKLYVGSLGTLGIIVEATFRLYPIPEMSETYIADFSSLEELRQTALSILNSSLVPTSFEALNPDLSGTISDKLNLNLRKGRYAIAVRVESEEKAVREQVSKIKDICAENNGEGISIVGSIEQDLWQEIREFPWRSSLTNRIVYKASILINDVTNVFNALEELSNTKGVRPYASASLGNGILIIYVEGDCAGLVECTHFLRGRISTLGGTLVVKDASPDLKSEVDVWGEVGASLQVMKRLKSLFDPNSILSPGRFVGGI